MEYAAVEEGTPAEWALRWVWNHPELSVALSGMGSMEQVTIQNVAYAEHSQPHNLTAEVTGTDREGPGCLCLPNRRFLHGLPLLYALSE